MCTKLPRHGITNPLILEKICASYALQGIASSLYLSVFVIFKPLQKKRSAIKRPYRVTLQRKILRLLIK